MCIGVEMLPYMVILLSFSISWMFEIILFWVVFSSILCSCLLWLAAWMQISLSDSTHLVCICNKNENVAQVHASVLLVTGWDCSMWLCLRWFTEHFNIWLGQRRENLNQGVIFACSETNVFCDVTLRGFYIVWMQSSECIRLEQNEWSLLPGSCHSS